MESIAIVKCRQLLVSDPKQAARLAGLLRAGTHYDEAIQVLGRAEIDDRTREYALEELSPDVRAEIDALAGGWLEHRAPLPRAQPHLPGAGQRQRERRTLPALGAGLDTEEQNRVAAASRQSAQPQRPAAGETSDLEPASVVQQQTPEYPQGATGSGEVTVDVEVGLSDDLIDARIVHSSDTIFETSATDAARAHSTGRRAATASGARAASR
jgi:hypothetical protein